MFFNYSVFLYSNNLLISFKICYWKPTIFLLCTCEVISTSNTKSDIDLSSSVVITYCPRSISLHMVPYNHISPYNEVHNCIVSHDIVSHNTVTNNIVSYYKIWFNIVLYDMVFYHMILHYILLHHIILHYMIWYCIIWYRII